MWPMGWSAGPDYGSRLSAELSETKIQASLVTYEGHSGPSDKLTIHRSTMNNTPEHSNNEHSEVRRQRQRPQDTVYRVS